MHACLAILILVFSFDGRKKEFQIEKERNKIQKWNSL